jgi:hypothetical protein
MEAPPGAGSNAPIRDVVDALLVVLLVVVDLFLDLVLGVVGLRAGGTGGSRGSGNWGHRSR